ncbi:Pao retrotransposon peptidase [Ancylostoma duodenale]|uniref:Pao retrotransposon peptidase n=1 Tax=Ancylostoma duodenale TaxID=51022 RepID=A0A0C2GDI7_9BILA|nr:Pao retrotransposon peptidase [Ancylostoma duodenale]
MNIRDYVSNNQELNRFMEEQEKSKVDEQCKILGVTWRTTTDKFEIHLSRCTTETTWTKRRVLQKVASTYDPFGWISPVVLVGKIFIQKLWTENITWDESLPQHLLEEWTQIIESWILSLVTFPRLLIQDNAPDAKYDIHVFTDASQSAYSASSYLLEKINGHPKRAMLFFSKSRLAPKKPLMTIPKLELSGLLIGANLLRYLKLHLNIPIDRSFLWSDSRVALSWSRSQTRTFPYSYVTASEQFEKRLKMQSSVTYQVH